MAMFKPPLDLPEARILVVNDDGIIETAIQGAHFGRSDTDCRAKDRGEIPLRRCTVI